VETRESILFEDNDVPALLRQQSGDGRPGRAPADDQDIAFSAILHF
jgi:hypothetical protein